WPGPLLRPTSCAGVGSGRGRAARPGGSPGPPARFTAKELDVEVAPDIDMQGVHWKLPTS
ncbi:hypothetical protein ACFXO2_36445, partial [Streptomyces sp. NPDC059152]